MATLTMPSVDLVEQIPVLAIRTDAGTQTRAELNGETVADYAEKMTAGIPFPPILLFYDGSDYFIGDGFHRLAAAKKVPRKRSINAIVKQGTRRDALAYSLGANSEHGLPRTNKDKVRAVTLALEDEEWRQLSDKKIALMCRVSQPFVSKLAKEIYPNDWGRFPTTQPLDQIGLALDELPPKEGFDQGQKEGTRMRTVTRSGQTYQLPVGKGKGKGRKLTEEPSAPEEKILRVIPQNKPPELPTTPPQETLNLVKNPRWGDSWKFGSQTLKLDEPPSSTPHQYALGFFEYDAQTDGHWSSNFLMEQCNLLCVRLLPEDLWNFSKTVDLPFVYGLITSQDNRGYYLAFFGDAEIDELDDSTDTPWETLLAGVIATYTQENESIIWINPNAPVGTLCELLDRQATIYQADKNKIAPELARASLRGLEILRS